MITETQRSHQDVWDLLVDACQTLETIRTSQGTYEKQLILDPEKAWWKTHLINSPYFGSFAKVLLMFEGMALDAKNHMTVTMSQILSEQILQYCQAYRYSIDAKSSETLRDKHNTQPALIDKMQRTNQPHAMVPKTEKSLMSAWLGKDDADEE